MTEKNYNILLTRVFLKKILSLKFITYLSYSAITLERRPITSISFYGSNIETFH